MSKTTREMLTSFGPRAWRATRSGVIDGRIDAPDRRKTEVLKAGRIVFTFKMLAKGRHGRGGGERTSGGSGAKPGNGGSSDGQSAAQSPGRQ